MLPFAESPRPLGRRSVHPPSSSRTHTAAAPKSLPYSKEELGLKGPYRANRTAGSHGHRRLLATVDAVDLCVMEDQTSLQKDGIGSKGGNSTVWIVDTGKVSERLFSLWGKKES